MPGETSARRAAVLPAGLLDDGPDGPDTSGFRLEDFLTLRAAELNRLVGRDSRVYLAQVSDLTLAEWRILAKAASLGETTVNGLAAATTFDKAQISRTVSSLVAKGLMAREAATQDSRSTILTHTDRGRAVYDAILPHGRQQQRRLLRLLTPVQRAALYESMHILAEFLRAEYDDAAGVPAGAGTMPERAVADRVKD